MTSRIIVGMSGGVDSSLAAALLKEQGFDVIGVTLQLYHYEEALIDTDPHKQHCHPLAFIQQAKAVADVLNIPHHVVNREELFRSTIIDPFLKAYQKGMTPLPCVTCNRDVKTAALCQLMPELGATGLATGHYVRRSDMDGKVQLHQGQDQRDQSFFLFALTQQQLDISHFPLGYFSKEETRERAHQLGLSTAYAPSSQDLCFIAKRSYKTLFEPHPGDIYHEDGRILGTHQGLERYTIGQRQGIGIGGSHDPLYVINLEAETNRVIVGPRQSLARSTLTLRDVNWLGQDLDSSLLDSNLTYSLSVKVRSSGAPIPAKVVLDKTFSKASVTLSQPDYGIAQGQVCVFYQGTRLLGGGWIDQDDGKRGTI